MTTLFLLLFFSKTVLLTPEPITLNQEWTTITPKETFSAITGGAALNIQLSLHDPRLKQIDKENDIFNQLEQLFPSSTIEGKLFKSDGNFISLTSINFSISDFSLSKEGSVWISLSSSFAPFPTDIDFKSVQISSKVEIKEAKVIWKNFSL